MRAVIVYESMYGNTRQIAEAIAEGFTPHDTVRIVPVYDIDPDAEDVLAGADLIVVGGPTHAHSMSRPSSRKAAADAAQKDAELTLLPGATGQGLRDWLATVSGLDMWSAAFDTRLDAPAMFTGRAAVRIDRVLHQRGAHRLVEPESFFVTKRNRLSQGELERARGWGRRLAESVAHHPTQSAHHARS
jgi:hypothetical protein